MLICRGAIRKALRWVALPVILMGSGTTSGEPFDYDAEYLACVEEPEYSAGGAMVGDCFNEQARNLDATIETRVLRVSKRFCTDEARGAITKVQSQWLTYRENYCALVEQSPGNTPSWISAGACRVDLARKRLETLRYLEQNASMWCLDMALDGRASRFGSPVGVTRSTDTSTISWEGMRTDAGTVLRIGSDGGGVIRLDTTNCRYCEKGRDCADGVFVLARPGTVADRGGPSTFNGPAVLNICHDVKGGVRLDIVSLDGSRPVLSQRYRAESRLDWNIDRGRLWIVPDGNTGNTVSWPGENAHE